MKEPVKCDLSVLENFHSTLADSQDIGFEVSEYVTKNFWYLISDKLMEVK